MCYVLFNVRFFIGVTKMKESRQINRINRKYIMVDIVKAHLDAGSIGLGERILNGKEFKGRKITMQGLPRNIITFSNKK